MGLCGSSAGFEDRFITNVQSVRSMIGKLKVGDEEAKKIFHAFEKVDQDKSGQIDVDEFFNGLRIEPTPFGECVFKVADVSNDGEIDFGEFFVAIYNFCSFDEYSMMQFCFNIFDVDRSGEIDKGEVRLLITMMRGKSGADLDQMTTQLLRKLDTDGDGMMSIEEFQKLNKKAPSMLAPAFNLKNQLTEVICGASWWKKQETSRKKLNLGDLIPLYTKLRDDGDMEKKLEKRSARIQKDGMGSGTVSAGKGCTVHVKPSQKAPVLSKLKKGALVDIAEDKTLGEGAKKDIWYRIGSKRWVRGTNITVLSDDWRHKKAAGGGGGGGGGKKKGKARGGGGGSKYAVANDPGDWQKHEDASTGKSYWYSKKLKKTTWKDPMKAGGSKKKKLKVAGQ